MPSTYSRILQHFVFSTKHRRPLIEDHARPRLFEYLGGACRGHKCVLLEAGGVADHVHLLVGMNHDIAPATLMREVKSSSSRWLRAELGIDAFAWQEGYGVFSVSESQRDTVRAYLLRQAEHHQSRTFLDELTELLRRHRVEYDPRYLLD